MFPHGRFRLGYRAGLDRDEAVIAELPRDGMPQLDLVFDDEDDRRSSDRFGHGAPSRTATVHLCLSEDSGSPQLWALRTSPPQRVMSRGSPAPRTWLGLPHG